MPTEPRPRLARAVLCAALVMLVFGTRAWLAAAWGSALPFWDEWDAEAWNLYRPWLDGTLTLRDMFQPHNEHRVFLTRAVDLVLLLVRGRWDPWLQIIFNALLHAATAGMLAWLFWPALPRRAHVVFVAGLALLFTSTCGWQNALHGFQSQVYLSNLFTVGAVAGLVVATPLSRGWWVGWLLAAAALLCVAAGVLGPLAVLITALLCPRGEARSARRQTWLARGLMAAVVAAGLLLYVDAPQHSSARAQTVAQFCAVGMRCMGWPHVNSPVLWLVMQAPLALLLLRRGRARTALDAFDRCALALAIFAALQAAAIAFNRGGGLVDARPLSRYQDPLLLGAAAQCFAACRLAAEIGRSARLLALGWGATVVFGLLSLTTTNLTLNLPYKRAQDAASIEQVRAYLATRDPAVFTRDPLYPGPHPNPQNVQRVLDHPRLRPILPAIFFAREPEPASDTRPVLIAHGRLLAWLAVTFFVATLAWAWLRASNGPHPPVITQPRAQ